jgi:glycosyltransferase involved in cell wall biosynthesis
MKLPKGSVVVDYGCCEGNQVMNLAGCFPDLAFVGIDHSSVLVDRARVETVAFVNGLGGNSGNQLTEIPNLRFMTPEQFKGKAEVVLLTEVLEHVIEPWLLIDKAERMVRKGGRIITTTPLGPWEAQRVFSSPDEFGNREHLWHLDKGAMRTMVGNRPLFGLDTLPHSMSQNGLVLGNLCGSWLRPDKPRKARPLNPLLKAATVPNRQIVGAAIITMNDEADILRMLKSVAAQGVRDFSIAIGPSTDRTLEMIKAFAHDNPWCQIRVIEVPRIEAGKFGFDDARNASLESLSECDWILWIDSDEELVGKMGPYIRDNAFQSYCVHQHHVTCEPRGAPIQIDKPARLFRTNKGFSFAGKVHEHAEIGGCNGGPGFTMPLPELDIMHIGYKNEVVRRGRFNRNLPFLRWDRHVNPERKLGKFLWLRDLVHQMRYAAQGQDAKAAMGFANEAVTFYDKEWEDMASFGNGLVQGFQYVSEARGFLGVGTPIDTQIAVNGTDRTLRLQGQITTPEELTKIINYSLRDECKTAGSKYR